MTNPREYRYTMDGSRYRIVIDGDKAIRETLDGLDAMGGERWTQCVTIVDSHVAAAVLAVVDGERDRHEAALRHIAQGNISPSIGFARRVLDGMSVAEAHASAIEARDRS